MTIWRIDVDGWWLARQVGLATLAVLGVLAFVIVMWVSYKGGVP